MAKYNKNQDKVSFVDKSDEEIFDMAYNEAVKSRKEAVEFAKLFNGGAEIDDSVALSEFHKIKFNRMLEARNRMRAEQVAKPVRPSYNAFLQSQGQIPVVEQVVAVPASEIVQEVEQVIPQATTL